MCPKSPSFLIIVSYRKMGLRIQGKHFLSCWIYLIRYENAVLNTHMAQVNSFLVNKKNTRILQGSTSYYAELRKYIYKVYSNFASYLRICSTEEDQIHNVATLDGAYLILTIPCPMLLRRLKGPCSAFIKPDQLDPWIKDQIKITLLSTIAPLQLPNFVSCGRDKPSHMTQNLVTVGATLWTAEYFLLDPWSMDQADLVW